MPSKELRLSDKAALPFKTTNKARRQQLHIKQKQARDVLRRADRFARKKEEAKNPKLREQRLRENVPQTLESKRKWDDVQDEPEDGGLGVAFNVERLKRRKLAEEQDLAGDDEDLSSHGDAEESDRDSMLDEDEDMGTHSEADDEVDDLEPPEDPDAENALPTKSQLRSATAKIRQRASSPPARSTTSTNLSLAPAALSKKFPTLFLPPDEKPPMPKILVTTSINSTLHHEAEVLVNLLPNSKYVRRSSHRYGHKFSVREIAAFAAKREYTTLAVLEEDMKKPSGLVVVHLPVGPTFHFTITNWYEGKAIPGHGRPTSHIPELILNNFTTPLGLLTAHLFRSMYPSTPELQGRQVVTLHNQRDFIFLRKHRYVFREKREMEKSVVGADGKEMKGAEGIRAGLQELGPRLTLKLRRVDKGIQRASGQEWEWRGKTDRVRTKFQL
ncbi:Ribosome production factor 1 [Lithohypha guttulata]|uniref:Ribosome production factor 1 n=1 Tax=Lithohypha guttulata TaxID=1690604 RepID=UPI002DDECD9A|nr:Ribosome production factor 1 [Lithohypha guttulata]KAK5099280.1 Ribosome production factor 1 [Lithohypha guttulata]